MSSRIFCRFIIGFNILVMLLMLVNVSRAADIILEWPLNPSPDLVGYKIYYGIHSGNYPFTVDVGRRTGYTVTHLEPGRTYYFALKIYGAGGRESAFSRELSYTFPGNEAQSSSDRAKQIFSNNSAGVENAEKPPLKPGTDKGANKNENSLVSWGADYALLAGLGFYPADGGRIEVIGMDDFHQSWLQVGWPDYNSANGEARVATGDIDGDGKDEIIIGLGPVPDIPSLPAGFFQVLDDDYTHLTWGKIEWADYNDYNGETRPACADLDGDGKDEIIVGLGPGGEGRLEIFDYVSGTLVHRDWIALDMADYNRINGGTRPASGDIDGDGKDEIVISLNFDPAYPGIADGLFQVLDDDYSHLTWGQINWPDYNRENGETRPACGDLDGDGKDEIILGLGQKGGGQFEVFAYLKDNLVHKLWHEVGWEEYNRVNGETRPACGNVDDDEQDEIFFGFGKGGEGWIVLLDDASHEHKFLSEIQVLAEEYNITNGETWLSIQSGGM